MTQSVQTSKMQKLPGERTFLFWNLNGKDLLTSIRLLVEYHDVDVLILAECSSSYTDVLRVLNPARQPAKFDEIKSACQRIMLFTRFPGKYLIPISEDPKYTICSLQIPGEAEVLFVAVHLLSWKEATEKTLHGEMLLLAAEIRRVEEERAHERTFARWRLKHESLF